MSLSWVNFSLDRFRQDKLFIWSFRLSLFVLVLGLSFLVLNYRMLPPVVPAYYSLPWGEEQLGSPLTLLALLLGSFGIYVLTGLAAILVYPTSLYFARMLISGGTLTIILAAITTIQIILLIT